MAPPDPRSGPDARGARGAAPASLSDMQVFFTGSFDRALAATSTPLELFRHTLRTVDEALADRFHRGVPVAALVHERAWYMDELLLRAWARFVEPDAAGISLVAVGGYGRGELHPHSDIDLLILLAAGQRVAHGTRIERLLAFLWDIGLKVGHSVRTVDECVDEAGADVGVATNLMEARLLAGEPGLFDAMAARTGPAHQWPPGEYFTAKYHEQVARHARFNDTAYNLEPNVKEGPGGLRDLQTIAWIARRHFGTGTLDDLTAHGFLTEGERATLSGCRDFLWKVRYALHLVAGRDENRLLFDHQQALAREFGYVDDAHRLAVEKFMKDYYRTITELSRLNEMLLQLLREVVVPRGAPDEVRLVNSRFRVRSGFLEAVDDGVFRREPFALLEIFLLLEKDRTLEGVAAGTIRLIRDHRHLVDERFRADPRSRSLFMEILRQERGVTHELRRMNRYGILAAYLPAFGAIVGQMQYDLFHVFTVDDHTLQVVRNVRRFMVADPGSVDEPYGRIARRIARPEVLYLAALFHDIAKGRGGDHSELGATDAFEFCRLHGLEEHDALLVAWLVRHHLLMSMTAQHKDISDPEVITAFARTVGEQTRLDHLYLLTVADIRGTNPALWNSWKDALLRELYAATRQAMNRGLETPVDRAGQAAQTRAAARALLQDVDHVALDALWSTLDTEEYFLRHSPDEIAWQARQVLASRAGDGRLPLIRVRAQTERGGTEIFIYARDQERLFALSTGALDQLGLDIASARIITTSDGYTLDTYIVLGDDGEAIRHPMRIREIEETLARRIAEDDIDALAAPRRPQRRLRNFLIPTQVVFSDDAQHRYTIAELVTVDRPGLLARVGRAFVACGVKVVNAKIATFGERVEDVFFITDRENRPLDSEAQLIALRETIMESLDEH